MVEIITHIAFYIGWPNAWAVFPMVREVYQDDKVGNEPMFGLGKPNDAFAKYFIGQSYLNPLNKDGIFIANVTFEPGCRNNWHIHHAKKEEDKSYFVLMEKVIIKKKGKKLENFILEM